jgi:hypothetical protein
LLVSTVAFVLVERDTTSADARESFMVVNMMLVDSLMASGFKVDAMVM